MAAVNLADCDNPRNQRAGPCARIIAVCQVDRCQVDTVLARLSTAIAMAPDRSSSPSRFDLSRMSLIAASITTSLAAGLKKTEIALGTASLRVLPSCPTPLPFAMSSVRSVAISPGCSSFDSESSSGLTLAKS
eukprot:scaffold32981_cov66-Phaeocystis_antarctica.AAC.4